MPWGLSRQDPPHMSRIYGGLELKALCPPYVRTVALSVSGFVEENVFRLSLKKQKKHTRILAKYLLSPLFNKHSKTIDPLIDIGQHQCKFNEFIR